MPSQQVKSHQRHTTSFARLDQRMIDAIVSLLASEPRCVPAFLASVLQYVGESIPSDLAFIGLIEESSDGRWVVLRDPLDTVLGAELGEWGSRFHRLKVGGSELPTDQRSFVGLVAHLGTSKLSRDVHEEECYRASNPYVQSEVAVPIFFQSWLLGILNLESKSRNRFHEDHLRDLELVARLIAPTLECLMIQEGMRRPAVDVLEKIGHCLSCAPAGVLPESSGVFTEIASIVAHAFNSDRCIIFLSRGSKDSLELSASYPSCNAYTQLQLSQYFDMARQSIASLSVVSSPEYPASAAVSEESVPHPVSDSNSFVSVPLLGSGAPVGTLVLGERRQGTGVGRHHYNSSDLYLLNMIQTQIGAFIDLKRLEVERRNQISERSRQLSALSDLFSEGDLTFVLQKAALRVPELCGGKSCSIFLWDPRQKVFVLQASKGLPVSLVGSAQYAPGEGLTGWVGLHGKSLLLDSRSQAVLKSIAPDLSWASKYNEEESREDNSLQPFAAVPIFLKGVTVGILRVSGRYSGSFTEGDEIALNLVAAKISAALSYSRSYEERIRLLQGLQTLMIASSGSRATFDINERRHYIMQESVRQARLVFRPDIAIIYPVLDARVEYPPVWNGDLHSLETMLTPVKSNDVPASLLVADRAFYWEDCKSELMLVGPVQDRDIRIRPRFVEREEIVTSAAIPLKGGARTLGILFLNYRTPQEFDPERRELIEAFAVQVALSLELVALEQTIHESASREEALELAWELHDVVSVLSSSVVNRAGSMIDQMKLGINFNLENEIRSLEKYAGDCAAELRGIIGELERTDNLPASFSEVMVPYIRSLGNGDRGAPIKLVLIGDETTLYSAQRRTLFLVARELILNARRHAFANTIDMSLAIADDEVILIVSDDGVGMDEGAINQQPGHWGLKGVRHRTQRLGGSVDVISQCGKGCTVKIVMAKRAAPPQQSASAPE